MAEAGDQERDGQATWPKDEAVDHGAQEGEAGNAGIGAGGASMSRKSDRKKAEAMRSQRVNSIGATDIRRARGEIATEAVEYEHDEAKVVFINGRKEKQKRTLYNVDRVQDYINRYWKQNAITDDQWKAGRRFALECESSLVGVRSQLGKGNGSDDPLKALCDVGAIARLAGRRASAAIKALGTHAGIAIWVAAHGRAASEWAEANRLAPPEGIRVLRVALTKLATHYGVDNRRE